MNCCGIKYRILLPEVGGVLGVLVAGRREGRWSQRKEKTKSGGKGYIGQGGRGVQYSRG